ncbi:MAG: UDP-N-acetylmuramate--alanine ligase [Solirubrobacteraceae bacterium]|nr:UDP-N-acetylmuramate--alanine ligase [Solirubrobacteraceae bacterium]
MSGPWAGRRLHLVGLGGAGMSAYALAARALGADVSGSDRADSPYLVAVRAAGIAVAIGHDAGNLPDGDDVEVVHSSAIPADNPERAAARERGLPDRSRAELLGELTRLRRVIAFAGAHGKTTTTSMAAHALIACGADPGYLIGGELTTTGTNAAWGTGEWLVVEADESDRSLLALDVDIAVLTNVELDHVDEYASLAELEEVYRSFLAGAPDRIVGPGLERLAGEGATVYAAEDLVLTPGGSQFRAAGVEVVLRVPGEHNARNAAAALTALALTDVDLERAAASLADFRGAGRRFQELGRTATGALVVDDYAHHPTEVAATIAAARTLDARRVVAVFQPHLYSRTAQFAREFGAALAGADVACVVDVYPARERAEDFPGIRGLLVAEAAADHAGGREVMWLPTFADAEPALRATLRDGDLCLVLGAGDIDTLGRSLVTPA